jgi:hypothetical protein
MEMATLNLPEPYGRVDELAERGDYAAARETLARTESNAPLADLCEVKIALLEGSLPPQLAMNRLLALMQKTPNLPGAHDLYRQASAQSYQSGHSSLSHSHPPPPIKRK